MLCIEYSMTGFLFLRACFVHVLGVHLGYL